MVIKRLINEECQIKTGHVTWQRQKERKKALIISAFTKQVAFHSFLLCTPGQSLALGVSSCTIFPSFLPSRKPFIRVESCDRPWHGELNDNISHRM